MKQKSILGVRFHDFPNADEFLNRLLSDLAHAKSTRQSKIVAHLNAHCLNLAHSNKNYNRLLNDADLLFFDSVGLKIVANTFLNLNVRFASTPPEWMHEFFSRLPQGTRLYFVGDEPKIIETYHNLFCCSFPELTAVGYHHGFFKNDLHAQQQLTHRIQAAKPDIVLVGMGMPIQEFWIQDVMRKVQVPMFIPVGAYFQRMIGVQKRPAPFIANIGMEWLYRLILDPQRMFKRYGIGNFSFMYRVLRQRFSSTTLEKNTSMHSAFRVDNNQLN